MPDAPGPIGQVGMGGGSGGMPPPSPARSAASERFSETLSVAADDDYAEPAY